MDPAAYEPIRQAFIEQWSQLMVSWGFPKALGTVHAHLLAQSEPVSMAELRNDSGLSQGTTYSMLKRLADLGLLHEEHRLGIRTVRYLPDRDVWQVALAVLKVRREKELKALLELNELLGALPAVEAPPMASSGNDSVDDAVALSGTLRPFLDMAKQVDSLLEAFTVQDEKWWKRMVKRWISRA